MTAISLWIKLSQWITRQNPKNAVIFLLLLVLGAMFYENYRLHSDNERDTDISDSRSNRNDSIISILNLRIQECNDKRQADLEKSNEFWSKKYDELQERLYKDYETIKQYKKK